MTPDPRRQARSVLSGLREQPGQDMAAARGLQHDVLLVARLLAAAAAERDTDGQEPAVTEEQVAAALSLFDGMREALDRMETEVVFEARRRQMDWRQIAGHQGLNSSQAASQRYQRLVTRLEEIRQGVR